jgi:hypothetical protein
MGTANALRWRLFIPWPESVIYGSHAAGQATRLPALEASLKLVDIIKAIRSATAYVM